MKYRGFHYVFVSCLLLTTGTCQRPIVFTNPITPGNSFEVYCDDDRVLAKTITYNGETIVVANLYNVSALKIYRSTAEDTGDVLIANFKANTTDDIAKISTRVPEGRKWRFSHYGDNYGNNNKDTIKLLWIIDDTRCEDAGSYTCEVQYYVDSGRTAVGFNITENVVIKGDPCVNPIVVPKPMNKTKPLNIYCDASRFNIPENDIFIVSTLTIYRDSGMIKYNTDMKYKAAQYLSGIKINAHERTPHRSTSSWSHINKPGRIYEFKFSGADSAIGANKNMSIEWTILDPENEDVRTYTCDMEYFTKDYKLMKLSRQEFAYFHPKREDLLPVLSVDRSKVPGYFNITCDAKRVRFPVEHTKATGILETRITVAFDKMPPSGEGSDESLNREVWTDICDMIRSGRKWEVIKGDYRDNYANIDTASTKVIVHDPSCDDAGTYRCDIVYRDAESKHLFHKVTEKQRLDQPCE